jgi:hypothetical protein
MPSLEGKSCTATIENLLSGKSTKHLHKYSQASTGHTRGMYSEQAPCIGTIESTRCGSALEAVIGDFRGGIGFDLRDEARSENVASPFARPDRSQV